MNLLDVRKRFIEFTGRYDLIVDTDLFADNGADWYIQQGQRWLDRAFTMKHSYATNYRRVASRSWFALIPECRAIQEVWLSNAEGKKWKLEKFQEKDWHWARRKDPRLINITSPTCRPTHYYPISTREVPELFKVSTIDVFFDTMYQDTLKSSYNFDALVFLPPVSEALELEVHGLFYQRKLTNNLDRNVWTEEHEFVLVLAACRVLESTMRNTAGVNDYEAEIGKWLQPIELDFVEEVTAEATGMQG